MSDITMMKGYGFPRGSKMDYAGYAGPVMRQTATRTNASTALLNTRFPSEWGMVVSAMITLRMISRTASVDTVFAVFKNWMNANGYTVARYGTRADDLAIEALVNMARGQGRGAMTAAGYGSLPPVHHPDHPLKFHGGGRGGGFGMLMNTQRRRLSAYQQIPMAPEPGIFSKIPALDGLDEFGTEYTFTDDEGLETHVVKYGPEYRPDELGPAPMGTGTKAALGLGLLGLLYLATR